MYKMKNIHMVGIGGIGMSGIAEVLHNSGYTVTGSDIAENATVQYLRQLGIKVYVGHKKENINGAQIVVYSSAVKDGNEETDAARAALLPVVPRAEMLAELMRPKYGISIAGAHGKTSTTAMIATILERAGFDPTIIIGGRLDSIGSTAKYGKGSFFVAEADESDGSFLMLSPAISVVTNIDREHLDFYNDLPHIKDTFLQFVNKVPFYGMIVLCSDDDNIREIMPRLKREFCTYGLSNDADMQAQDIKMHWLGSRYDLYFKNKLFGEITLTTPGIHTVYNSLAAISVALELEVPFPLIQKGIEDFKGADRRFQIKGEVNDILVIDDYAHHPTEIETTLKAVRIGNKRRVLVVFQPHRYTRTMDLLPEFSAAFHDADVIILTNIYSATEKPIPGIHAKSIMEGIKNNGKEDLYFVEQVDEISDLLLDIAKPGDIVVTLGAGNIWMAGEQFLEKMNHDQTC
ncbi:MAG: UDP-N-acetylmuramate--L-alanine ligase [bacterium]